MSMRFPGWRQAIAEIGQLLTSHQQFAVREGAEDLAQMELVRHVVFTGTGLCKQAVIKRTTFWRQRHAALFNFAKARGMRSCMLPGKQHRLFQRFKAGLAQ